MNKLLCVIMSAIILSTTVFAVSAAEVTNSVSATTDEAQEQTTEEYCDGFYYAVLDDGTAAITSCNIDKEEIVKPDTIKGLTVTQIQGFAWRFGNDFEFEKLKKLYIGKNITYIDDQAFYYTCKKLTNITVDLDNLYYCSIDGILFNKDKTIIINYPCGREESEFIIPNTVNDISSYCFAFNQNLTDIIIPDSVTQYGWYSFYTCNKLKNVTLGNGITSISGGFSYCNQLESITFGNSVQYINLGAFHNTAIKSLYLPESVNIIDGFYETPYSLENVFIDNENYVDVNGILYSREEQKMLLYPASNQTETLCVPEGITSLSLISNKYLKEIYLPTSVTNIEVDSIYGGTKKFIDVLNCSKLQRITVDGNNQTFSDIDGVLYTKDQTEMLIYPPNHTAENLSLPENTTMTCEITNNNIKTLVIPATLTELGNIKCESLENIIVSENNQVYCSIEGVLYNKDVTELISIPLCAPLEELVVPETVEVINCRLDKNKYLKNVYLNKYCTQVYGNDTDNLFPEYESVLENVFVAEGNSKYYSLNGVLMGRDSYAGTTGAIYNLKHDCVILYPQKNKNKSFRFPENTIIISLPQYNLYYLEDVYIPASVEKMLVLSFSYCRNLKNFYVDGNNPYFCDIDGVLYSKDKKTLLRYPQQKAGKTYEVCKDTEILGDNSFYGNETLTNITIPDNIKRINWAFNSCSNLKEITVSKFTKEMSGLGWSCTDPRGHGTYTKNDDLVIKGYTNSPAETYAKKNGFTFISLGTINKLGDSNSDGVVNIIDATTIQRYLAEYEVNFSENEEIASDTNGDGYITISDVTEIQRFLAELPSAMSKS